MSCPAKCNKVMVWPPQSDMVKIRNSWKNQINLKIFSRVTLSQPILEQVTENFYLALFRRKMPKTRGKIALLTTAPWVLF